MKIPQHWFVEPVTVQTVSGTGPYGDSYAEPVTVLGHITGGRRVQFGADAEEQTSTQRLLLPNPCRKVDGSGTISPSELVTAESLITSGSIEARVTSVTEYRKPGTNRVTYLAADLQ